eukprot:gnl/MRDRNA2_/MRDRNA2_78730_c0_seq1.p1 gnl/MRDRNA2_/MRDRNA2_78730_c0~~gnl/MRDRNA2_/MRDRNA2_78730_c0_seq1.p1  ORF type:complete len:106 (-),score=13.28 gnl/MRDRNA2_/MRDRNA2_78730_c0_seq1:1-318(-)
MMPQPQAMMMPSPMPGAQGYPAPFMQPSIPGSPMRSATPPPAFRKEGAPITPVQTMSLGRAEMTPSRRPMTPSMVRDGAYPTLSSPGKPAHFGQPVTLGEFTPRR